MLFMVVEKFRNQDGKAVYRKLRDAGRSLPDGLKFVASYVSADLGRCFQLMETDDVTLFQRWIADWQEVVEFEVVPVVEGKTTREALAPILWFRWPCKPLKTKDSVFEDPPYGAYLFPHGSATFGQNGVLRLV